MTLGSIWVFIQYLGTLSWLVGLLKKVRIRIAKNPEKKPPIRKEEFLPKPSNPIPGNRENGGWIYIYGTKKYDTSESESAYIWGIGSGLSVRDSSHRKEKMSVKDSSVLYIRVSNVSPREEMYRVKESNIFFLIRIGCFVGEYSREEVLLWLETHGAPMEAYERAGIELRVA